MDDLEKIRSNYEQEFTLDDPVVLNNLIIYPIKMDRYFLFNISVSIFLLKKNSFNDPKIITMSYLEFLIYLLRKEDENSKACSGMLYCIISLCLRKDNIKIHYGVEGNNKYFLSIDGVKLYKEEFDTFRKIIICQNLPNYDDSYINPELEKELKEVERLKAGNAVRCSIEKQMVSVTIRTSLNWDEVKNLTVRKFHIILEMIDKEMLYVIYKTASLSGFVTFKQEINHYLLEDNSNSIDNKVVDYNQLQNKINSANI